MIDHSDKLGTYKGYPVIDTKIVVKGIGDGLSNPVAIEPTVVEPGKTAFLAVRVATSKHRYEFASDDEGHIIGVTLVIGFLVKNLTDDFLLRSNGKEFWMLNAALLGVGVRRMQALRAAAPA